MVRTRRLSDAPDLLNLLDGPSNQRCNAKGCLTCPLLFEKEDTININGQELKLDYNLTCKDKNIIYVAQCQICVQLLNQPKEDSYIGQSLTPFHIRMNGHRSSFKINDSLVYQKSALSMHCFLEHRSDFDLKHFKIGIVKRVRPVDLNREEEKRINRFRTKIWGLNRIDVIRSKVFPLPLFCICSFIVVFLVLKVLQFNFILNL